MKSSTARIRPPKCARLQTAGAAPGSIIAAIIGTHRARKDTKERSCVEIPMSIPFICRMATTHEAAASPSVAVSAAAGAAALVLVVPPAESRLSTRDARLSIVFNLTSRDILPYG